MINAIHNEREGQVYSGMTQHKKCGMGYKNAGSGTKKFLVIPIVIQEAPGPTRPSLSARPHSLCAGTKRTLSSAPIRER